MRLCVLVGLVQISACPACSPRASAHLRARDGHEHRRVTFVELFFDLVFVFAVTQLSHSLLAHFTPLGALQTALLLMAVWWVWIYTSWATNWLDPGRTPVRLMLFALMLAGLVLSASIPEAFERPGLAFAGAYVAHPARPQPVHAVGAAAAQTPAITATSCASSLAGRCRRVFWIAGGFAEGETRGSRCGRWRSPSTMSAPIARLLGAGARPLDHRRLGRRGRPHGRALRRCSSSSRWANRSWSPARPSRELRGPPAPSRPSWSRSSAASRCGGSISTSAPSGGSRRIAASDDPGGWRALAYTYMHLPIVAGIIVTAVGDELVLAPSGRPRRCQADRGACSAGRRSISSATCCSSGCRRRTTRSRIGRAWSAGAAGPPPAPSSPLSRAAATAAVLIMVALWEWWSLRQPADAAPARHGPP